MTVRVLGRKMNIETYLYISPHLDDAVLSAGGLIASQLIAGERVIIATICTADPVDHGGFSPLAIDLHRQWGNPERPYQGRRREDIAATRALGGAEVRHLGLPDAIYRGQPDQRGHRYETFEELFEPIPDWDQAFADMVAAAVDRLVNELEPTTIFGPLGVGANVDHLHVRNAVLQILDARAVGLYEEQPYSTGRYPVVTVDPVTVATRACSIPLQPKLYRIQWEAKCRAIRCYESQLTPIFGRERAGLSALEVYSRTLDASSVPMERVWYPHAPPGGC
jgi:LmbE family N-acetylglucosaminyl deacetylase